MGEEVYTVSHISGFGYVRELKGKGVTMHRFGMNPKALVDDCYLHASVTRGNGGMRVEVNPLRPIKVPGLVEKLMRVCEDALNSVEAASITPQAASAYTP